MSTNLHASVRQRLLNQAKAEGRVFDEVLKRYAIERFLYRLSVSKHAPTFVLKGAQLLRAWMASSYRPTQDLDLLGHTENSLENMVLVIRSVCEQDAVADGIVFNSDSVTAQAIKEDADYQGVRVTFVATLGSVRIPLQLDVGFNDIVTPEPVVIVYPVMLDFPAPKLRGYTPQTVIAEKLEAMVMLGERNSRMKDFFDLLHLSQNFELAYLDLRDAIQRTFARRNTELPTQVPVLLQSEHPAKEQKQIQWNAFRKKSNLQEAPESFDEVSKVVRAFVEPVLMAEDTVTAWSPQEGWR